MTHIPDISHSFNVRIAEEYGLNAAVVYNHIVYWLRFNAKKKDVPVIDGHIWMYETQKDIADQLGYLTEKEVKNAVKRLVDGGVLITRSLSKNKFDRTNSYSTADPAAYLPKNSKNVYDSPDGAIRQSPPGPSESPRGADESLLYIQIDKQDNKHIARPPAEPHKNSEKVKDEITFNFEKRKFEGIKPEDSAAWRELYPHCDIYREVLAAEQWVLANPAKGKKTLWRKFLMNWLSRSEQMNYNKKSSKRFEPLKENERTEHKFKWNIHNE